MQTRVITLRFNELVDGFDDTPLRGFIRDKVIVSVNEHFRGLRISCEESKKSLRVERYRQEL